MSRPIILVTGANNGVGLGVCERLLVQLASPCPSDGAALGDGARPRDAVAGTPFHAADGCTLILACRDRARAQNAVAHLERLVAQLHDMEDDTLQRSTHPSQFSAQSTGVAPASNDATLRQRSFSNERSAPLAERGADARTHYRRAFCRGTRIETVALDLASAESTLACASDVRRRVPYLTHVVLNAGGSDFTGVNWLLAAWQMLTAFHGALTIPSFKQQRVGATSSDGYGWVWQVNVGMHYALVSHLMDALRASPYATPSRVVWTGSLEARAADFHMDDIQCVDPHVTPHPYESTKYQCELTAIGMDARLRATGDAHAPRAFSAHPGIVATNIFGGVIHAWLLVLMKAAFYVARWTFSSHHVVDAYKGAVAAVYVAVAPAAQLDESARYGAQCTWSGHEYVHAAHIGGWDADPPSAERTARELLTQYDALLQPYLAKEGAP
ncbi:3beta-hydroxysteroid 3-dehydrogenase [Malassezia sp. CBS 17886]|nr:3beta-hydroxysteroid 3-dehydrogenase [Malassezia sp. CBS 17886]